MRRVESSNVLVVQPFEVAWFSDEASALTDNSGYITFEARGQYRSQYTPLQFRQALT